MKQAIATLVLVTTAAVGQQTGRPTGLVPQQVWPAPTAEDWKKPVPIRWQRTWPDAVRLARETRRPILICINMDGEIASEHYAGIRYRDPEVCKLFEPYVCVVASVYRHNPRDYDEQGRRIPCPRLGCVTCGEHIAMERVVYEKFLEGKRISPRHIMVELDGTKTYDVFHTWDVQSVLDTLRDGIANRSIEPAPVVKGDRSLLEEVASADSADRQKVERSFLEADRAQREAILNAALELGEEAPIELLRLAAYGLDPDLAKKARKGLLKARDPGTVELIADTLRAPLPEDERRSLVSALDKFADSSARARTLATAQRGLTSARAAIDPGRWLSVLEGPAYTAAFPTADAADLATERDRALAQRPDDPDAKVGVAEATLLQALSYAAGPGPGSARRAARYRRMLFLDAKRQAEQAIAAGAGRWRARAVLAVAANHLGERERARELATRIAPELPPDAPGELAMEVLTLFAEARQLAIRRAVRHKEEWPASWTADVHAAYAVLERHPLARDAHFAWHFDFLDFFGTPRADAVLEAGLERFPASPLLHARLRSRCLRRGGSEALRAEYARRVAADDAPPEIGWFAGYAEFVIAEEHRKRGRSAAARTAYERAIERFAGYAEATDRAGGARDLARCHAGIAAVELDRGDLDASWRALEKAFAADPLATAAVDGLSRTALMTADELRARAAEAGRDDLTAAIDAAIEALPDEAFVLPDYEQRSQGHRLDRRRR